MYLLSLLSLSAFFADLFKSPEITTGPAWVTGTYDGVARDIDVEIWNSASNDAPDVFGIIREGTNGFSVYMEDKPSGFYDIVFRSPGSLKKRVSVLWNAQTDVSGINFSLKYGDLNQDNYVSAEEVAYIQSHIGCIDSEEWMFPANSTYQLWYADFDSDQAITQADYALAAANVGQYGD